MIAEVDECEPAPPRVDLTQLWRPALLYVSSRALVLLAFVVASAVHPKLSFRYATSAWDGGYYFGIANFGYPKRVPPVGFAGNRLAFFPAYPLAIRGVEQLTGLHAWGASMIVVFVFGFAAACCLWLLTRELSDTDAADRATALFAFGPGSFVLSMAYPEALFVLSAVTTCWALIRRRWFVAGILGAIGAASRPDGLAIVLAAACAAYFAFRQRREWRALVAVALAASGWVAVMAFFWYHTGDAFAFFKAERRGWRQGFSPLASGPRSDVRSVLHTIIRGGRPDWNHIVLFAGLVLFVAAFVVLIRWRPPVPLVAFTVGLGLVALTSPHVDFRPRLLMSAFPLSMALGIKLRRGPWFSFVLGASAMLLVVLAVISTASRYVTP